MAKISAFDSTLKRLYSYPELFLIVSFLILILVGATLLHLPWMTKGGLSWIDAFFTATSAVCVTGLVVKNTALDFTFLGQLIILVLIQLGGLGIMTFSASFLISMGRGLSSYQAAAMKQVLDQESLRELKETIAFIFKATVFFELMGAMVLGSYWIFESGRLWPSLYWGIFHSISAFCNAGFSVFPHSFSAYRSDVLVNAIMGTLILAGGLGFVVLRDLYRYFLYKKRLSIHTKLVLVGYGILLISGIIGLYWLNHDLLLRYPLKDRFLISWFHSVNARTAGFNSVDIDSFSLASKILLVFLMFIGAGSGSTGGGIKVSTFFLLVIASYRYVLGHKDVVIFRRTVLSQIVQKASAIFVFSILLVFLATMLVALFDPEFGLDRILFEVVSAFGTVGLSCGITENLSLMSKVVIIFVMFIGRVGPLTMALALLRRVSRPKVEFAKGHVMVG